MDYDSAMQFLLLLSVYIRPRGRWLVEKNALLHRLAHLNQINRLGSFVDGVSHGAVVGSDYWVTRLHPSTIGHRAHRKLTASASA